MKSTTGRRRGRSPMISTATEKIRELRRHLKSLVTETQRIEQKLVGLDVYYRSQKSAMGAVRKGPGAGMRGRGANVRDVAYDILSARSRPMPIRDLADRVIREKGGKAGDNFVQNLGAALHKDRRFKRSGRGLYGTRR